MGSRIYQIEWLKINFDVNLSANKVIYVYINQIEFAIFPSNLLGIATSVWGIRRL